MRTRGCVGKFALAALGCAALRVFDQTAWAGQFTVSKSIDAGIDVATYTGGGTTYVGGGAWVAASGSTYGRAINGNSFETSPITTFNGYQYTAYWKNISGNGVLAVARRAIGTSAWQSVTVPDMLAGTGTDNRITNGPNDAHDVVSLGIDRTDGTLHLAYDMHGHTLRYRIGAQGVATNPASFNWGLANAGTTLFPTAERSNLNGSTISGVTYPMFINTPNNDLQLAFRIGSSGNGSWFLYDYNGTSHAWSNGHQIDDGTVDTYVGTTNTSSSTRNNYPNNFTYGSDGRLYSTFTWRESATGAANHDILYVYSEDGGNTWKNNAGTIVASQSTGAKFHLNSPGLVVRPLPESQTLMNQNGQGVDHANHPHAIVWHRDPAKDPSLNNVWEPQESSYYQYWRDDLGNWHQNKINGNVGQRPKIFFDANDNAFAIYQVATNGAALSGGSGSNLYVSNGDLVIAAASKISNWTDWKIIRTETGPFVSEAQADTELFGSNGTLSVMMQNSPTLSGNQGTTLRSLDYSINYVTPSAITFKINNGDWDVASNWNGGVIPTLNNAVKLDGGAVTRVDQVVPSLDNMLVVGSGGTGATLNVVTGGSLNLLGSGSFGTVYGGSIIVGGDSASVGTYTQSGGTVNAWRFAVGDYSSETSGGGVSSATVSGGSLTTYELDIAFSANGSSSGSSFNVAGGSVTVNGDVIVGEFGNTGSLNLTGGTLTIAGDLREGFNRINTSNVRIDGGTLDMSAGYINVDNLIYDGGAIVNVSTAPTGTNVNSIAAGTMSGMSIGTVLMGRDLGAGSATTLSIPAGVRMAAANRIELWPGASLSLGAGAAVSIGTAPVFTADRINLLAGGTLAGDGTIAATLVNAGGVISPGHSIGTLHVASNFSQAGGASAIEIELGAAGNDQLSITGSATLAGTMRLKTVSGFTPLPGNSFDVMSFASRSGDLTIDNQTGFAGLVFSKSYSANQLSLIASALYNGDANLDGAVNSLDFAALASHFNGAGATWLEGDFNGDGTVNALDFNVVATAYGSGAASAPLGSIVPEPSMALGLLTLLRRSRRR